MNQYLIIYTTGDFLNEKKYYEVVSAESEENATDLLRQRLNQTFCTFKDADRDTIVSFPTSLINETQMIPYDNNKSVLENLWDQAIRC